MDLLNPRSTAGKRSAETFEACFAVEDAHGPFSWTQYVGRGEGEGGEWAANRCLYPYPMIGGADRSGPARSRSRARTRAARVAARRGRARRARRRGGSRRTPAPRGPIFGGELLVGWLAAPQVAERRRMVEIVDADCARLRESLLDPRPTTDARGRTRAAAGVERAEQQLEHAFVARRSSTRPARGRAGRRARAAARRTRRGSRRRWPGASARTRSRRAPAPPSAGTDPRPGAGSPSCSARPSEALGIEGEKAARFGPAG